MNAGDRVFIDTNVLLYALVPGQQSSSAAEEILAEGPLLSVQVLHECVDVLRRKARWSWDRIEQALDTIQQFCGPPRAITFKTHQSGVAIARRFDFRVCDALIIASALEAGCTVLFSENMQAGQKIHALTIRNPFAAH